MILQIPVESEASKTLAGWLPSKDDTPQYEAFLQKRTIQLC